MDNTTKTNIKARLISFFTASAILATSLPFFQEGFGANLATVIAVWAWFLTIVGVVAAIIIGVSGGVLLWTAHEELTKVERDNLEKASHNLTKSTPRLYWSLPLTAYWIGVLAYVDSVSPDKSWGSLLVVYVLAAIIGYLVTYGLLVVLKNAVNKAIADKPDLNDFMAGED